MTDTATAAKAVPAPINRVQPRLKQKYRAEISAQLKKDFGFTNVHPVGCKVTLRRERMYEFLDRLVTVAIPRIRDFRGLSDRQFDGHGNYTFGLNEQSMFHEIDQDKIDRVRGFDITVVTTAKNDDEGRALLKALGFPFKSNETTTEQ